MIFYFTLSVFYLFVRFSFIVILHISIFFLNFAKQQATVCIFQASYHICTSDNLHPLLKITQVLLTEKSFYEP